MYLREVGPNDFPQTFQQWMDSHTDLKDMIAEGRGKLEWERKIPDEKLVELKDLLESKDFKTNMSTVRICLIFFWQLNNLDFLQINTGY